ncbi:hypothetical protein [Haladaptatus caseinilyticus]|uniref:hypothetical protein n=1 Tax=Haladaptatus caseinilyticus TaxID=2993314 RepID=UPI00224B5F17|nr:hypothetical protein [Haladaptatus caseinilyticus]
MATRVPVSDWDAIADNLHRFASNVDTNDTRLIARMGVARFTITRDGHVTAGMPLHDFDGRADSLVFDHRAGTIRIERAGITYVFRRP